MTRWLLIAAGTVVFAAASVAVLVAPDRLQWVIFVRSAGANEIVIPIGYWAAIAVWGWVSARILGAAPSDVARRVIGIGFVLNMVLLLAVFSRDLGDRTAFSTPFYRMYARLFCATALAGLTAWAIVWARRQWRNGAREPLLEMPVLLGTAVLAVAVARHDPVIAGAGLAAGCLAGAAIVFTSTAGGSLSRAWRTAREIASDERVFLVLVCLVALGLRLFYTRRVMTDPNYVATGGDGPTYDALAWSIAQGQGVPASFRNGYPLLLLGYVWFVGLVYAVAGHSYFVLCAIQSALGAAACVLTYAIGRALAGAAAARLAAVFTAFSFLLIFSAAAIGHQAVDVFLTVLVAWLLLRATTAERLAWPRWAGIGVVMGCAIAVRETNAVFLVFAVAWVAYVFTPRLGWAGSARAVAALMLGVIIVLAPLAAPMMSSAESRLRLRLHFDRLFKGQGDDVQTRKGLAGPLEDPSAALSQLRENPGAVARTIGGAMIHNFALQFFTQPYGGFDLVFLAKGSAYYYGLWFYGYAFACAGIVAAIRRVRRAEAQSAGLLLVLGVIVFRTLPHLILESHFRHRAPIEPFLIIMASAGAASLWFPRRGTPGAAEERV